MTQAIDEVNRGERFGFGANWTRFLRLLDDRRIATAERAMQDMLGHDTLTGATFLDIGSGSGLSSLVARRLGARVLSIDYDPQSVACTQELQRRYYPNSPEWRVEQGSALDREYLASLGQNDVVYSWGVLHHTGQMWAALENVVPLVKPGGRLFVAIYNDQGWMSRYWLAVKRVYNASFLGRLVMTVIHLPYLFVLRYLLRAATNRLELERGMSLWYDMVDWLGGLPFEVARPEAIVAHYLARGFELERLRTCGGRHGCNEYVLRRR